MATSLAYPSGEEGGNFLVQLISTCLRKGEGVGTLWDRIVKIIPDTNSTSPKSVGSGCTAATSKTETLPWSPHSREDPGAALQSQTLGPEQERSSVHLQKYVQCCGSGMFIPNPDFYPFLIPDLGSRIPDPKTATKERGEKKLVVRPFFVATNFTKLIILFFKC